MRKNPIDADGFPPASWWDMVPTLLLIAVALGSYALGFSHGILE
jgi:hypothetical protein